MTKRIKSKPILSRLEFERCVDEIAQLETRRRSIKAERDASVQVVQEGYNQHHLAPVEAELKAKVALAEEYALDHRDALLPGKLKSAETPLARWGFRTGTPALKLLKTWTWEKVLAAIERLGLDEYVRRNPEVDKATILADAKNGLLPDGEIAMLGIKVVQEETFFIEPKTESGETVKAETS